MIVIFVLSLPHTHASVHTHHPQSHTHSHSSSKIQKIQQKATLFSFLFFTHLELDEHRPVWWLWEERSYGICESLFSRTRRATFLTLLWLKSGPWVHCSDFVREWASSAKTAHNSLRTFPSVCVTVNYLWANQPACSLHHLMQFDNLFVKLRPQLLESY